MIVSVIMLTWAVLAFERGTTAIMAVAIDIEGDRVSWECFQGMIFGSKVVPSS